MLELPQLTTGQYGLVYNLASMTIAVMGAAFVYIIVSRNDVAARYRPALLVSAVVVGVAAYHYFRITGNLSAAFEFTGDGYAPTGEPFNPAYRYVDWLITVPLLLVEIVAVAGLARNQSRSLIVKLTAAAVAMIVLGYPGETAAADATTARLVWGTLSTIPFAYLLYVLFVELGRATSNASPAVSTKLRNLRLLLVGTWGVYPIAYLLPVFASTLTPTLFVGREIGYSVADMLAKAAFGVMIVSLAKMKSAETGDISAPVYGSDNVPEPGTETSERQPVS